MEEIVELALDAVAAVAEGCAEAGGAVEYHDGDPVILAKERDGTLGGVGYPFDVGPHGGTDIQKEKNVEGHFFRGKVANLTLLAVVAEQKVLAIQCGDGTVVAVHNLDIDANQRDVTLEDDVGLHGLLGCDKRGRDGQENGQ